MTTNNLLLWIVFKESKKLTMLPSLTCLNRWTTTRRRMVLELLSWRKSPCPECLSLGKLFMCILTEVCSRQLTSRVHFASYEESVWRVICFRTTLLNATTNRCLRPDRFDTPRKARRDGQPLTRMTHARVVQAVSPGQAHQIAKLRKHETSTIVVLAVLLFAIRVQKIESHCPLLGYLFQCACVIVVTMILGASSLALSP